MASSVRLSALVAGSGTLSVREKAPTQIEPLEFDPGLTRNDAPLLCSWEVLTPGKRYRALGVVEEDEDGGFWSHTPSLPGAASQGETKEEALENLREAIAGCIEVYRDAGDSIPWVEDVAPSPRAIICRWIDIDV
jgi:predicted RNase H-like HicB family nuclease